MYVYANVSDFIGCYRNKPSVFDKVLYGIPMAPEDVMWVNIMMRLGPN